MSNPEVQRLMTLHGCFQGLDDKTLADIGEQLVLVRCTANECIHAANTPLKDIYFIIQGSLKVTYLDLQGNERLFRVLSRDEQFGVTAAALTEPLPASVTAREPTTLLKLDFQTAQELTSRHAEFRTNLLASLANSLRQVFFAQKSKPHPRLLGICHSSPATYPLTQRLVRRLVELGEEVCVLSDRDTSCAELGATSERLQGGSHDEQLAEMREQVRRWSGARRIVVEMDARFRPALASHVINQSDALIWCARPVDLKFTADQLAANAVLETGCCHKIQLVWVLDEGCQTSPVASELSPLVARDFKVSLADPRPPLGRLLANGVERLVHCLRGVQVGLALGGGAARGMAHLGVLQALERHGIVIDMIAGTSAGALTGIPYASGLAADHCAERFAKDLTPTGLFRCLPSRNHLYLLYKYRSGQFDGMLRKYLSDWNLEQLGIPSCAVTVDLVRGEPVVRDRGDAVHAILESINLPVLNTPIVRDGRALVDGGLVKNIPADVLVQKGCNFVFAVSVTARIEREFARNRPDTPTARMRTASTFATIMRSFLVQSMNVNAIGVQPADFVIEPDVTQFDLTEFTRAPELAHVGDRTTVVELPQIKKMLQRLDEPLFAQVTER